MHIKFLDHGKGSAAHASAYVLDKFDHQGNVRAGVQVLRGDANTFNAICDSSPHLWKYTSGVIAWSKEDDPTDEQIQEVLDDFEKHAFSGLDPFQYHLFAVLHTDDDGSKHIHVLVPRLDIQSGKSLNIAPPGHEKHFDSLRDYLNTKHQWSRPDDILKGQTTQEPNYVAKLNAQAKKILDDQDFMNLTRSQFNKAMDNYVKTLLKTQTVKNRAEIVSHIEQLQGVSSVRADKTVTVIFENGKRRRLPGDFYHEQFEIGLYSERLRAAAESRPTPEQLEQAIRDAESIRDDYRAKRATYNAKQHAFAGSTADDNSSKIASKLDIDRNKKSITSSPQRGNSELQSANRSTPSSIIQYGSLRNIESENEHRFLFNLSRRSSEDNRSENSEFQNRPVQPTRSDSNASTAGHREPNQTNRKSVQRPIDGKTEQSESLSWATGDSDIFSIDAFNQFLLRLSSTNQSKNHRSTKADYSTKRSSNIKPNAIFGKPTEIRRADRNRLFFERTQRIIDATKQLVSGAKQGFESTSRIIKDHLERLQRTRAEIAAENQSFAIRETRSTSLDLTAQKRVISNRAGQFITRSTAEISKQLNEPITNAINNSFKPSGFKQYCEQYGEHRNHTNSPKDHYSTNGSRTGSLETLTTESLNQYRRRLEDSRQATTAVRNNAWQLNLIDRKFKQLDELVKNIRIKPQLASSFFLRYDQYYPDYVKSHERLSGQQDQAYKNGKVLDLIDCIASKIDNLQRYTYRAHSNISNHEYNRLEKIIKNDEIMLKYLNCDAILEKQNDHLIYQREHYKKCLTTFKEVKNFLKEKQNHLAPQFSGSDPNPENKQKSKPRSGFDFDF